MKDRIAIRIYTALAIALFLLSLAGCSTVGTTRVIEVKVPVALECKAPATPPRPTLSTPQLPTDATTEQTLQALTEDYIELLGYSKSLEAAINAYSKPGEPL